MIDAASLLQSARRVPRYTSYPTAPHFHGGITHEDYALWLHQTHARELISLYVHVPFCAALCWYCGCNTKVVNSDGPINRYLDLLEQEIALVKAALPQRMRVGHLHLGGGTPNRLSPAQVTRLQGMLMTAFDLSARPEVSVELDPRQLTDAHIRSLVALGTTRASLGVQDFHHEVQEAINRLQPFEVVADAMDRLIAAGIADINFDLIYGLPYQTVETLVETVELAASLNPNRIALFGYAHVPWMKPHQKLIPDTSLPNQEQRLAQEEAATRRLVELGYVRIGLDHFARPDDSMAQALGHGTLKRNFQGYTTDVCSTLIGLGPSSIGAVHGGYIQNHTDMTEYAGALAHHRLPIAKGLALSPEDRYRREVIERLMCDLRVNLDEVAARHGVEVDQLDVIEVERLAAMGICRLAQRTISVPDEARVFMRLVCAAFDQYLECGTARHSLAV